MSDFNIRELEEILSKPFVNLNDISILLSCSRCKASSVKQQVQVLLKNKNIPLINSRWLPTKELLDFIKNDTLYSIYNSQHKSEDKSYDRTSEY